MQTDMLKNCWEFLSDEAYPTKRIYRNFYDKIKVYRDEYCKILDALEQGYVPRECTMLEAIALTECAIVSLEREIQALCSLVQKQLIIPVMWRNRLLRLCDLILDDKQRVIKLESATQLCNLN